MHDAAAAAGDGDGLYCPDCHRTTATVLDHTTGDTICTECALVLDARFIDETSEWRTFSNDGADDRDPNRVGDRSDPFLSHHSIGTSISFSSSTKPSSKFPTRSLLADVITTGGGAESSEKALVAAFRGIADMADRLGLVATIRDRAKQLYKRLEESKSVPRCRNRDAVHAACLFIACRNEGNPRTYKELASAVRGGAAAAKKEIGRMTTLIKRQLGEEEGNATMDIGVVRAEDYLRRFCSRLGLGHAEVRAAAAAARRIEAAALDVRRNPESVAAAVIYLVVQRAGAGKSARDVAAATGVAEGTISAACKELAPHAAVLFGTGV
uniref:TFIIB-type domain-containing protein n=1 Tax=Leersia perrieri TaxID=77586 RepID=A0A0D9WJC1_9ORYZ